MLFALINSVLVLGDIWRIDWLTIDRVELDEDWYLNKGRNIA